MRNLLIAILVLLVGAVAGRWVLIQFYPNFAIAAVYYSMQQREKTPEGWLHVDPIDETSRTVVRPAYDLLYSVCNADLANSGYYISLPPESDYTSISVYNASSDNIFSINDQDPKWQKDGLQLIVSGRDQAESLQNADPKPDAVINTNSPFALIIQRRIIRDRDQLSELEDKRRLTRCLPLS